MRKNTLLTKPLLDVVKSLQDLNQRAVLEYTPVINDMIRTGCRDIHRIEHTLDNLLGFCGYDPALQLYRRLCRHYFDIDQNATVDYINAYREMWDKDSKPKTKLRSQAKVVISENFLALTQTEKKRRSKIKNINS